MKNISSMASQTALILSLSGVISLVGFTSAARASHPPLSKVEEQEKHLIFDEMYGTIPPQEERPSRLDLKALKAQVKENLGLNVYSHLRLSLDSVKSKSSLDQKSEIIALESHLAPRGSALPNAKGYGIAFKVKFD